MVDVGGVGEEDEEEEEDYELPKDSPAVKGSGE